MNITWGNHKTRHCDFILWGRVHGQIDMLLWWQNSLLRILLVLFLLGIFLAMIFGSQEVVRMTGLILPGALPCDRLLRLKSDLIRSQLWVWYQLIVFSLFARRYCAVTYTEGGSTTWTWHLLLALRVYRVEIWIWAWRFHLQDLLIAVLRCLHNI